MKAPNNLRRATAVQIQGELYDKLKEISWDSDRSATQVIRLMLETYHALLGKLKQAQEIEVNEGLSKLDDKPVIKELAHFITQHEAYDVLTLNRKLLSIVSAYLERKQSNPLQLILTLDEEKYGKLKYISEQTGLALEEAARFILNEYFAVIEGEE